MKVTLTTNGTARFARIKAPGFDTCILLAKDITPSESLRSYADELQTKMERLARQISLIRAAADALA